MLHLETTTADLVAVLEDCIKDLIALDIESYNKCPNAYDIELWAKRMDLYKVMKDATRETLLD